MNKAESDDAEVWGEMKMIHWWRLGDSEPAPDVKFVAMVKTYDIGATIAACIRNAAPGMVGMALCRRGGSAMIKAAREAANERGIRILWWNGPEDKISPPEARPCPKRLKALTQ